MVGGWGGWEQREYVSIPTDQPLVCLSPPPQHPLWIILSFGSPMPAAQRMIKLGRSSSGRNLFPRALHRPAATARSVLQRFRVEILDVYPGLRA